MPTPALPGVLCVLNKGVSPWASVSPSVQQDLSSKCALTPPLASQENVFKYYSFPKAPEWQLESGRQAF